MPGLAHSAVSPLPGNLPLTQLCLPLTRRRNNSPAFPCKFHLSQMETSSTCSRKHRTRGQMKRVWEDTVWPGRGRGGPGLPLPRNPLRAGVTIPVTPAFRRQQPPRVAAGTPLSR